MMDNLSDLMSCCRGLDTEKVTERKKSAEKLRQLLGKNSVIKNLDRNTDEKVSGRNNNRLVTWDDVFKAVVLYIRLETASLQKAKETQSHTSHLNREKKKQEISGFFKFFVRTADKRGPRLKHQNILSHILAILKDEYTCRAYGQDYSSILLKNVLPVRKYWVEIRAETWHELLNQYCQLYLVDNCGIDRVILTRLLHAIISGATKQCDLHTKKLLRFFTEVFKNIRQEKGNQVQEHLLSALNIFVKKIAPNSRVQICELGEAIFVNLLYVWNTRPSDYMKDVIVEFMQLQLHAHHPGGVRSPETGELTINKQLWMSHLRKLYEVMYTGLQQMGGRNRFTSGTKEAVLKPAYVDLAADVCNQLFSESSNTIEVTQLSILGDGDHSTPSKKRRLESGWTVVRDTLYTTGSTHQVIPWLQLVTRLVEKYPSSIPEEELLPLLQCLHQLLKDCKRSEILHHIFQCLIVMASSYTSFEHITIATKASTRDIWHSIWSTTLRSMSSHQAEAEGYQQPGFNLLSAILLQKFVKPEKEVWNLFLPNVSSPNVSSVNFLFVCLSLHDLPENHQPSILGSTLTGPKGSYSLRKHLLDWIIPKKDASELSRSQPMTEPEVTSRVLMYLTVRNPGSVLPQATSTHVKHLTELEKLYLETSFDHELRIEKFFRAHVRKDDRADVSLLPSLLETLKGVFTRELTRFQDVTEPQISVLHHVTNCSAVLTKCIQHLLDSRVISPAVLSDSGLETCLKTMLRTMSSLLSDYVKKEGCGQLLSLIQSLQSLFPTEHNNREGCYLISELLRTLLPGKFFDILFDIAFKKMSRSNSNANNSNECRSLRRKSSFDRRDQRHSDRGRSRFEDIDAMDLEFDELSHSPEREEDDMDMDVVDDIGESQESDDTQQSDVCPSLVSVDLLPESHKVRLEVVRLLCRCCDYETAIAQTDVPYKAEMETCFLKGKLEELLDENILDPGKAVDLLVLDAVVRSFTTKSQKVTDRDLENMVDAIRQVARQQRREQEVCCLCLDLMSLIVPHLADTESLPSKVKRDCREITLRLLNAFVKLRDDGQYGSTVRLSIAKCMQAFVQCDPDDEWSYLLVKKDSSEDEKERISAEFPNCILDGCHVTRSFMTEAVHSLFVVSSKLGLQPKPAPLQHKAFDQLYENCNDLMEIKGKMTPEKQQDERLSRTASILSILATIACTSPINEKKAMFAVCQLIRERNIELEKVIKVLSKLSKLLGFSGVQQYMVSHLPYLINQWLDLGYEVEEFPHGLLGAETTVDFYKMYTDIVVPSLFMHGQVECIQTLATDSSQDWKEVLKACTPKIVIHILPLFAASRSDEVSQDREVKRRLNLASVCYDRLVEELTNEVKDKIIHSKLDMIVVNVLMCLHSSQESGNTNSCAPAPNPPSYNSYIIRSTLDFLTQSSSGNAKSLVSVLSKTQSSIQRVLLELATNLSTEHRIHEKERILTMYQLFVDMLLPEFADQLGGSWVFVLREVIHRLIQVITEVNTTQRDIFVSDSESRISMIETCLELLRHLCNVALECCPEELAKYLDYIVSNVIPFLRLHSPLKDKSQSLLNLLTVENTALLRDAITKLDPFPEEYEFSTYRTLHLKLQKHSRKTSLVEKLQHMLGILQSKQTITESCSETLQSLGSLISNNRCQLFEITSGSGDTDGRDVFCQLVCELLHLTQSSCQRVALQAAACLGIIGSVNLSTLSLPRKCLCSGLEASLQAYADNPVAQNYCWIFHKLNEYLLDPCINVVKTSGEVLRSMLATKRGVEFCSDYKDRLVDKDYLFSYLHPFKCRKPSPSEKPTLNLERFFHTVNSDILWIPEHNNHNRWVTDLTCALLKSNSISDDLLRLLTPICMIKPEFCEMVLPFFIHDILVAGVDDQWQVLGSRISGFFQAHCETICGVSGRRASRSEKGGTICTNKDSLQTMLNVVQFLRQQDRPRRGREVLTPWDNNFWLDLNYLEIAKAAQYCSAPFTAILYAEIWSNMQRDDDKGSSSSSRSQRLSQEESQEMLIDTLSSITSSSVKLSIQELLLEAYQSVSDPDGVYGCGAGRLADPASRIKTYLHENRVGKALVTYDIRMKMGQTQHELGLFKTLQEFGADHLLELCLRGQLESSQTCVTPDMEEIQYEAAWKTGQWNLDVPSRPNGTTGFHQALYCAMDALKDDQLKLAKSSIETARQNTLQVIDTRPESCRSIYPVLSRLHSLFHLEQIVDATDSSDPEALQKLLERLSQEKEEKNDFEFLQPVWNVKISALKILAGRQQNPDQEGLSVSKVLVQQLQNMARFSRKEGRYQVAERIISELKQEDSSSLGLQLEIEEAKLYWDRDEQNIAKHLIKSLIGKLEKDESLDAVKVLPQALGAYGNWLAETRTENPTVILESYLEKAVQLLETNSDGDIVEAYMSLAQFVDSQYQNIANYMKSTTFEAKQALMRKAKMDAQSVRQHFSDKDRYLRNLEKQGEIDEREVEALLDDRHKFLMKAVENYIKCLKSGDKHDLRIYRLTSLWFDNADSDEVNQLLGAHISEIKSYKFLPLMYQLAARMSVKHNHSPLFQPTLAKILESAAVDHPHHAVSVVMALAHANKDTELITQGRSNKRSRLSRTVSDTDSQEEDRVQAAKNLIEKLKKNVKVSETVRHLEILSVAYIELANTNVERFKKETKPISLPSSLMISKIKDVTTVALPTLEARVDPSGEYKDIVTLAGFADTFRLAGGINLPKILTVIGSDGVHRRQLVKGRDDLRQDAVMQQVFGMVNSLLKKNPETKKRNLRIRMYKVVPLSQRSGVLEWCEGTQPLGEYLIGSSSVKGAHPKYRPNDISAGKCREMLGKSEADVKKKLKVYREICQKFQPVFRHFFMERFSEPATWFEKRLAYTRSVATNSIVGYILGLGDRHVMNILIDRNSAELVHIDLGIAFEQGKILPTPETVPFRLTRDIVDGMGVTGVEGVFRRCCEKMMEVMHTNQESLMMILQVLLYDPLYTWSLTPQQALHIQHKREREEQEATELNTTANEAEITEQAERSVESQDSVNKMAERVLLRLHQKLQGIEDGIQMSVSGQVNNLIQEAKDPNNLCRLFVGWQPYL